jgi:hypothetical protein
MAGQSYNRPGIGNVGSYQASGYPYMTGSAVGATSEVRVQFPTVAKSVKVESVAANPIRVHFVSGSAGNVASGRHYWELSGSGATVEFSTKCKEVYISTPGGAGDFQLYAELTNINPGEMFLLTGSGLTD